MASQSAPLKSSSKVLRSTDMSDVDDVAPSSQREVADDGPNEEALLQAARVRMRWYVSGLPYISSTADLATGMEKLAKLYQEDFCWATCYKPEFVAELMYRGFLPMAMRELNVEILLPKIHVMRCLVMFADVPKPHGSTMKKAKKFEFSADTCFADVAAGIVEQHGENWFYPRLVKIFTIMNRDNAQGWFHGKVRVHSFEVWNEGRLVAGECGYSCGRVYTSLSGFTRMDSAGTVQMYAMVSHLKSLGFVVWDLGMHLGYKEQEFGGKEYPRLEFLDIISKHRDEVIERSVQLEQHMKAKDLLATLRSSGGVSEAEVQMLDEDAGQNTKS